jgi:hypothetical protein
MLVITYKLVKKTQWVGVILFRLLFLEKRQGAGRHHPEPTHLAAAPGYFRRKFLTELALQCGCHVGVRPG